MSQFSFSQEEATLLKQEGCPDYVVEDAVRTKHKIVKIVWDDDTIPDHARGFIQWTTRPYVVTDKCDGTRDSNAMVVCWLYCQQTGLDLEAIYQRAYDDREGVFLTDDYQAHLLSRRNETIVPTLNSRNCRHLLASLYDMNWRSLTEVLVECWSAQGLDVEEFWIDRL